MGSPEPQKKQKGIFPIQAYYRGLPTTLTALNIFTLSIQLMTPQYLKQLPKDHRKAPTSFPSSVLFSSETLVAKDIAATLRGCVTAMMPWRPIPAS